MRRRLVRICALLLLGAIVNVAVAWGCAAFIDATSGRLSGVQGVSSSNGSTWELQRLDRLGCSLLVSIRYDRESTGKDLGQPPAKLWPYWCDGTFESKVETKLADGESRVVDARGFPLLCLWSERLRWMPGTGMVLAEEVLGGQPIRTPSRPPGVFAFVEDARVLPLRPIWPGFAINTVFYAAILWLVFAAPFALRRRLRVKRGLCPKCAYDLRGRTPASGVCPECGQPEADRCGAPI